MRGILLMIGAAFLFTCMASLVKMGTSELGYHPLEVVLWRSVGSIPPALWLARGHLRVASPGWLAARCGFGFAAMFAWFNATRGLGIGELSVLIRLQPVFVGLLAPALLGGHERATPVVWGATILGLTGSAVLFSPDLAAMDTVRLGFAGLALFSACSSAVAHTALRALGATDDPRTTVFWFQVAAALFATGLVGITGVELQSPPLAHLPILLGIGLFAVSGQLLLTAAYQAEHAPTVAAASYVGPLFGFVIDVIVFGLVPSWLDGLGTAIVIAAGLLLVRAHARRAPA